MVHYYKHGKKEVKEIIDWIRGDFEVRVDKAEGIKELMAVEGEYGKGSMESLKIFCQRILY